MQLRTILAKDMHEALATMRAEMGGDAVIVGSQRGRDGGIMVRAALDRQAEAGSDTAFPLPAELEQAAGTSDLPASIEDNHRAALSRRLRGERPLNGHAAPGFSRPELLALMHGHRAPERLSHEIAKWAEESGLSDMALALASALDRRMKAAPVDFTKQAAILLVGPNGAGKTAVAAKLAAHARLANHSVDLIATDATGAGAVARLESFAHHLDTRCRVIEGAAELAQAVTACAKANVTAIIDTAGFDPRNGKARSGFAALARIENVDAIGVVSAVGDAEEVTEIAGALATLGAKSLVVTGVDLVRRLGAFAAAATSAVPLAHVTRSPYVAAGLETLTPLSLARALIAGGRPSFDERSAQ